MKNINNYDLLVVGAGFTGGIISYLAAARKNIRVLVLEKRANIAGNMYDEVDKETGILFHRYGPHIFHTNNRAVYKLITEVGKWNHYSLLYQVEIQGKRIPYPFDNTTIDTFYSAEKADRLKQALMNSFPEKKKVCVLDLLRSEETLIHEYADFLFQNDCIPYTIKQWGKKPEELDPVVMGRVPVYIGYADRNNFFDEQYECLPENGYTTFFSKMLDKSNIDIELNFDAPNHIDIDEDEGILKFDGTPVTVPVVYTAPLDELFGHQYGNLPYRSLDFRYRKENTHSIQDTACLACPQAEGYTRITEYTKLPEQYSSGKTLLAYEYPCEYAVGAEQTPCYPVLTAESENFYQKYLLAAKQIPNFYPCGRLADFRYYNMDKAIERGIEVYEKLCSNCFN
jgi:UDP-galactopyranose mutase